MEANHLKMVLKDSFKNKEISNGTLKTNDLISSCLDFMECLKLRDFKFTWIGETKPCSCSMRKRKQSHFYHFKSEIHDLISHLNDILREAYFGEKDLYSNDDLDDLLYMQIMDLLTEYAPDDYCFGPSDGDGACFGFFDKDI